MFDSDKGQKMADNLVDGTFVQRGVDMGIILLSFFNSCKPLRIIPFFEFTEKILHYPAEIRWPHGKFCGNPEGKLYKDFKWVDVPFFKRII